jgi:hypothetical protein
MGAGTTGLGSPAISMGAGNNLLTIDGETITNDRAVGGGGSALALGNGEMAAGNSTAKGETVKASASRSVV